jgi:hypothetical protein
MKTNGAVQNKTNLEYADILGAYQADRFIFPFNEKILISPLFFENSVFLVNFALLRWNFRCHHDRGFVGEGNY